MSITRSLPNRQQKICGLNSNLELKQYELFTKYLKEAHEHSADGIVETNEDTDSCSDASDISVCTGRKLRRIKRKLFLAAVKASKEAAAKEKLNCPKTRSGKE